MAASEDTIAAVREVLDRFAVDRDGVLIGTGKDEWRVGDAAVRAQVERDFAQADSLRVEYGDVHVDGIDGIHGVAWFATQATFRASGGGEPFESALRLTGVVSRHGDGWKIVQSHLSFPAATQEAGRSL